MRAFMLPSLPSLGACVDMADRSSETIYPVPRFKVVSLAGLLSFCVCVCRWLSGSMTRKALPLHFVPPGSLGLVEAEGTAAVEYRAGGAARATRP